jgi:ribosomal protein S12 methylthiotransferase accessory factor
MSGIVAVIGEGLLTDFVCKELSIQYQLVRQADFASGVPKETDMALVLNDAWDPSVHRLAEEMFQQTGTPWLRGFVSFGEGVIGPLVRQGTPGCSQCADNRRLMAGSDRKEMWELQQRLSERGGMPHDVWASRTGLLQVAHLLVAEAKKVLQGRQAHTEGKVFLINLQTLKNSRHFFLPDPMCPVCSQ